MHTLAHDLPAPDAAAPTPGVVTLQAPGRLHLGFLDPAGTLGRPFGSLGLTIEGYETVVEVGAASADAVVGDTREAQAELERARAHIERLRQHTGRRQPLQLRLRQVLPAHAGFGSGTQLALAIGRAFARWQGLEVDSKTLASWLGRGLRSGVGIAGFDHGGLLLDGGPGTDGTPAPLLSRLAFPPAWCVAVVQDTSMRGLSGSREKQAIARLDPLPQGRAAEICHQVLMRVLPGAASEDFSAFAAGVSRVQQIVGEHFAPAQGGSAYTSVAVGRLVQALAAASPQGAAIGQSGGAPTGFAVMPSLAVAQVAVDVARAAGLLPAALQLQLVRGRNCGARLGAR